MPIGPYTSRFLDEMVKHKASDMYITVGSKPSVRISHSIVPISSTPLQASEIQLLMDELLDEEKKGEFESTLELNVSFVREDKTRYRFNFFRQQANNGIVVRRINTKIPSIDELGLPEIYSKVIMKKKGLIILASPGGSGKSTSMAAMIGFRNKFGSGHVLTIEDPIEFIHQHGNCIITQREVGTDTYSYGMALKSALRQRADVIAIGEIRDRESLEHAMRFSETGHLCVATLHSNNAYQALTRMANMFPDDARTYVLSTISQNLVSIFSQRIVPNLKGELSVVSEILLNEGLIKSLISDNRLIEVKEMMERGKDLGMQTIDQSLQRLFEAGKISADVAISEAENPSTLKLKISQTRQDQKAAAMSPQKSMPNENFLQ